jgi:endonuclease/exonuclease/phosphatase (EEP) superfamily protein YafD
VGVNMFLPQWIWGIPGLVLLPLCAVLALRWIWLPASALLVVAGPLMGLCWHNPPAPEGTRLRVMTYNVQLWQRSNMSAVVAEIRNAHPDILCLQDARSNGKTALDEFLSDWKVASYGQYVIASRFPIVDSTVGDISYGGEAHSCLKARLKVGDREIVVSNAHFATPRDALTGLRSPEFWADGVPLLKENLSHRMVQARALADDLRGTAEPLIIAGDLNSPPPSLASRTLTAGLGLTDAFSAAGRGYGYTFGHTLLYKGSFLRLDHVLASRHFSAAACSVGTTRGSDHRPVIADLILIG